MNAYTGEERRTAVVVSLSRADMDEIVSRVAEANAASISQAMKGVLNEETALQFWSAGIKAVQSHAAEHTGRWVLGGVAAIAQKLMLFLFLGGIVYAVGGWSALAKLWHTFFGGTP